jgi:hypothetical protein
MKNFFKKWEIFINIRADSESEFSHSILRFLTFISIFLLYRLKDFTKSSLP